MKIKFVITIYILIASAMFDVNLCSGEDASDPLFEIKSFYHGTVGQVEADGYTYRYELARENNDCEGGICPISRLIVRDAKSGKLLHDEIIRLEATPDQCGNFPLISNWPYISPYDNKTHWLVVTCGAVSWKSPTIHVYMRDLAKNKVRTAELDFGDAYPNLTPSKDGKSYIARILWDNHWRFRKLQVKTTKTGAQQISFDSSFDSDIAAACHKYFREVLQCFYKKTYNASKNDLKERFGRGYSYELLSYLLAIQDQKFFCEQLEIFHKYGMSDYDIQDTIDGMLLNGDRKFNVFKCKEGAK